MIAMYLMSVPSHLEDADRAPGGKRERWPWGNKDRPGRCRGEEEVRMIEHATSWRAIGLACALLLPLACGEEPAIAPGETSAAAALDNQADPDDGKTCYQDVPMRKGKMELGMCCFDDPIKGTSECVTCDGEHHCTIGGAEPGALVRGDLGAIVGGVIGVLEPVTTPSISPHPAIKAITVLSR
jgi:hypothetical protein